MDVFILQDIRVVVEGESSTKAGEINDGCQQSRTEDQDARIVSNFIRGLDDIGLRMFLEKVGQTRLIDHANDAL